MAQDRMKVNMISLQAKLNSLKKEEESMRAENAESARDNGPEERERLLQRVKDDNQVEIGLVSSDFFRKLPTWSVAWRSWRMARVVNKTKSVNWTWK